MKVYHRAGSDEAAVGIERDGFRDGTGNYLTGNSYAGVWIADSPLNPNDYGEGQWDAPVFEMEVDEATIADCEWIEETKPYREWLVPAAVANGWPRRRLTGEEADAIAWPEPESLP